MGKDVQSKSTESLAINATVWLLKARYIKQKLDYFKERDFSFSVLMKSTGYFEKILVCSLGTRHF